MFESRGRSPQTHHGELLNSKLGIAALVTAITASMFSGGCEEPRNSSAPVQRPVPVTNVTSLVNGMSRPLSEIPAILKTTQELKLSLDKVSTDLDTVIKQAEKCYLSSDRSAMIQWLSESGEFKEQLNSRLKDLETKLNAGIESGTINANNKPSELRNIIQELTQFSLQLQNDRLHNNWLMDGEESSSAGLNEAKKLQQLIDSVGRDVEADLLRLSVYDPALKMIDDISKIDYLQRVVLSMHDGAMKQRAVWFSPDRVNKVTESLLDGVAYVKTLRVNPFYEGISQNLNDIEVSIKDVLEALKDSDARVNNWDVNSGVEGPTLTFRVLAGLQALKHGIFRELRDLSVESAFGVESVHKFNILRVQDRPYDGNFEIGIYDDITTPTNWIFNLQTQSINKISRDYKFDGKYALERTSEWGWFQRYKKKDVTVNVDPLEKVRPAGLR